jgi:hypothetical protein
MFAGCAFIEKGKCRCSLSFDLKDELASSSMLVFTFHEGS